jgi:hypothetical protein
MTCDERDGYLSGVQVATTLCFDAEVPQSNKMQQFLPILFIL